MADEDDEPRKVWSDDVPWSVQDQMAGDAKEKERKYQENDHTTNVPLITIDLNKKETTTVVDKVKSFWDRLFGR